jgi:hypothetical protein
MLAGKCGDPRIVARDWPSRSLQFAANARVLDCRCFIDP